MIDLTDVGAPKDSAGWFDSPDNYRAAWDNCPRGDWLLEFACDQNADHQKMILATGTIAETIKHLMDSDICIKAVEAAVAYGNGEIDQLGLAEAVDDVDVFLDLTHNRYSYPAYFAASGFPATALYAASIVSTTA